MTGKYAKQAEVYAILNPGPEKEAKLEAAVEEIAAEYAADEALLYDGVYNLAALGLDMPAIIGTLRPTIELADHALEPPGETAVYVVKAMYSYNLEADAVASITCQTIDEERVTLEVCAVANDVAPLATELGDSLEDTLESVAQFANEGRPPREIRRGLNYAYRKRLEARDRRE